MTATTDAETAPRRPLYEASTQFRNWRFSPEQLEDIRVNLNKAAVDTIKRAYEMESPGSSSDISCLIAAEEKLLVKLYAGKVSQLCGHFRFPEEVEATAVAFLKRFYLKNTVMDWHPKNVMLTALFLATKTTNHPISIDAYVNNIPKTAASDVLDIEFLVAQSLNFEFATWHAHRALWGIWLDIQDGSDVTIWGSKQVYDASLQHVRASRLTDAELIYSPSQIALASLFLASPEHASKWASAKGSESIMPIIQDIATLIQTDGSPPDVEAVREVDRRLKLCKNPEMIVGSKAYLAKKEKDEATAAAKRAKKAARQRKAMEDRDPFGDPLPQLQDEDIGMIDDDDDD